VLDAASRFTGAPPDDAAMTALAERTAAEPLFVCRDRRLRQSHSARQVRRSGSCDVRRRDRSRARQRRLP
jgi:hypothetical protein